MFSYVKSLMSRAVLGPSSKVENGNRDIWSHDAHQEMIQLIKFTSGAPGSPSLDIFVELGTVDHEQGGEESDKAEEVTEDMSNEAKNTESQEKELARQLNLQESVRRKRVKRMAPVSEQENITAEKVVAETSEASSQSGADDLENPSRPTKLDINLGGGDDILILSSPDDPTFSRSPSPESRSPGDEGLSPISDSDPVAELFPVKVKRSFTLRPTLRSLNR